MRWNGRYSLELEDVLGLLLQLALGLRVRLALDVEAVHSVRLERVLLGLHDKEWLMNTDRFQVCFAE